MPLTFSGGLPAGDARASGCAARTRGRRRCRRRGRRRRRTRRSCGCRARRRRGTAARPPGPTPSVQQIRRVRAPKSIGTAHARSRSERMGMSASCNTRPCRVRINPVRSRPRQTVGGLGKRRAPGGGRTAAHLHGMGTQPPPCWHRECKSSDMPNTSTRTPPLPPRAAPFHIGGDIPVHRLGFGAMRITGPGIWGAPEDHDEAIAGAAAQPRVGVNLIDSLAESYGPWVSEELIAEGRHPYPEGLLIATKGGLEWPGPDSWAPNGRPERLREGLQGSLRRLRLDRIDLFQLHRIDPAVPEDEQFGFLQSCQREGLIRHIGLSEVTVDQIERARQFFTVVSVQNRYNVVDREWEGVLSPLRARAHRVHPVVPVAGRQGRRDGRRRGEDRAAPRRDAVPGRARAGRCNARPSCCPSRARRGGRTSRRTWAARRCDCRGRSSRRSVPLTVDR